MKSFLQQAARDATYATDDDATPAVRAAAKHNTV